MQIAQLTKATLDVCHMDLNVILEATGNTENNQSYEEQLTTEQPGVPATSATFACSANV